MMEQVHEPVDPSDDLRKVINRHGYAFQEAVLRRGEELLEDGEELTLILNDVEGVCGSHDWVER